MSRSKHEHGGALVEFALAFPIFLFITFAVIELSLMIIHKERVESAVEEGLRKYAYSSQDCNAADHAVLQGYLDASFRQSNLTYIPSGANRTLTSFGSAPDAPRTEPTLIVERISSAISSHGYYGDRYQADIEDPQEPRVKQLKFTYQFNTNCVTCGSVPYLSEKLRVINTAAYQIISYYYPENNQCLYQP